MDYRWLLSMTSCFWIGIRDMYVRNPGDVKNKRGSDCMTELEIKNELKRFAQRIFSCDPSEAMTIKKELDDFVEEHNLTADQMMEFAESGAGEMLNMMTC